MVGFFVFTATRQRSLKTQFATIKPKIYLPERQFLIQLSPSNTVFHLLKWTRSAFSNVKTDVSQSEATFYNDLAQDMLSQIIVVTVDATHRPVDFFHLHAGIANYFHHGGQRFKNFGLQPTK